VEVILTVNNELVKLCKELVLALLQVLSWLERLKKTINQLSTWVSW